MIFCMGEIVYGRLVVYELEPFVIDQMALCRIHYPAGKGKHYISAWILIMTRDQRLISNLCPVLCYRFGNGIELLGLFTFSKVQESIVYVW